MTVKDLQQHDVAANGIRVVPLAGLRKWAHDVAPALRKEA